MTSSPSASPGAASLEEARVGGEKEIKAQSSSKRQPDANTAVKAVKCNVRAFPEAAGAMESRRELASTLAPAADRWSTRRSRRRATLEVGLHRGGNRVEALSAAGGARLPTERQTCVKK